MRLTTPNNSAFFFIITLLMSLLCSQLSYAESRTIKAGVYNTRPLVFVEDGVAKGLFIDVLDHIAKQENWRVIYVPGSWDECLHRLDSGEIDMVVNIAYSDERAKIYDYPADHIILDWGVVYRHKGAKFNNLMELNNKKVAVLKGDIYTTGFKTLLDQFSITAEFLEKGNYSDIFKAISNKEVDAGVVGNMSDLNSEDNQSVERTAIIFTPVRLTYAVHKGENSSLIPILERHISQMKADKGSILYQKTDKWLGQGDSHLSKEIMWGMMILASGIVLLSLFVVTLKRQILARTRDITAAQEELQLQKIQLEDELTERKRAEAQIINSNSLLQAVISTAPVRIFFKDKDLRYLGCNETFAKDAGVERPEDLIGKDDYQLAWKEQAELYRADDRNVIESGVPKIYYEEPQTTSEGKHIWLRTSKVPLRNEANEIFGVLGIYDDITEQKRSEEERKILTVQLHQAQKMEAIGTLAGGIAHDFNNILGAILGYAEMAREDCPPDSTTAYDLDKVICASHRATDLVKQILSFSRQIENEKIPLQPAIIVKEALKLLRSSIPSTIIFHQDIDVNAGPILADPSQIHQILMNLCTNAYHAMEEKGGTLSLTLKNKEISESELPGHSSIEPGKFVELTVTDTGPGIPLEIRDKIFEPYFTTKEIGKGTGMGLAIVHGVVKSFAGCMSCESRVGEGTTFRIALPVFEGQVATESRPVESISVGTERILFIDDEKLLVDMGQRMLERMGYAVTTRTNSLEALTTFKNQPEAFDLVITDQTMPTMAGIDLARRMLQIRPDLPIILCTGYSSQISEEKAKSYGIKGFALKPLAKKDLAILIRHALKGDAHSG